jgi:hypothetical protein
LRYEYGGPPLNVGCTLGVDCLTADEVLRQVFAWYESQGGVFDLAQLDPNAPIVDFQNQNNVPGATSQVGQAGIKSPGVDEITLGVTKRVGSKGLFRADLVLREWNDFYGQRTDLSTGQIDTSTGPADVTLLGNFDEGLERDYVGLLTQFRYRFSDRLSVAANFTWSELEGNFVGESSNSAADYATIFNYPEYRQASWAFPTGPLSSDQEITLRAWAGYDIIDNERHKLNFTWMENFFSGNPYNLTVTVDPRSFVTNPGYATPPPSLTYFLDGRGSLKTDDVHRTDVALNYSFYVNAGNRRLELFLQPEVLNLFDEQAVDNPNTSTRPLQAFNPFTETPVEGVNWERRPTFGDPQAEGDFQAPQTFRFSVGVRF